MPDAAPERARLKSYSEWLEIREKIDPPLAPDSIHRLPFINAKQASALIEEGIISIEAVNDPSVLGKSTRRIGTMRGQGRKRTTDRRRKISPEMIHQTHAIEDQLAGYGTDDFV